MSLKTEWLHIIAFPSLGIKYELLVAKSLRKTGKVKVKMPRRQRGVTEYQNSTHPRNIYNKAGSTIVDVYMLQDYVWIYMVGKYVSRTWI